MKHVSLAAGILTALVLAASAVRAAPPEVVVSLKPIHSIVAAVMDGVATPSLIVKGGASAHGYALRPSDATMLSRADIVVWVGEDLELFLAKPLAGLAGGARIITLSSYGYSKNDDPHIWLDPIIAGSIATTVSAALGLFEPANAGRYEANALALLARLADLDGELRAALEPMAGVPYVVFHEAYTNLEQRYGLNRVAAVTVNPQQKPGARRITELRQTIADLGVRCLFTEPQFAPALAETIIEDTGARLGVLDPLGADVEAGPEAYFAIMRGLAASLGDCLAAP